MQALTNAASDPNAAHWVNTPHQTIVDVARVCHEANRAYCLSLGDASQPLWERAPDWQHRSAELGVRNIAMGEVRTPQQSHENWCRHKYLTGWAYGAQKDEAAKTHPCLVNFSALPVEDQTKDYLFFTITTTLLTAAALRRSQLAERMNATRLERGSEPKPEEKREDEADRALMAEARAEPGPNTDWVELRAGVKVERDDGGDVYQRIAARAQRENDAYDARTAAKMFPDNVGGARRGQDDATRSPGPTDPSDATRLPETTTPAPSDPENPTTMTCGERYDAGRATYVCVLSRGHVGMHEDEESRRWQHSDYDY